MLRDQMSCHRDAGPHLQGALGWNLVHVSVGEHDCSCSIINSSITDSGGTSLFSSFILFFFPAIQQDFIIHLLVHFHSSEFTPCSALSILICQDLCCWCMLCISSPAISASSKLDNHLYIDAEHTIMALRAQEWDQSKQRWISISWAGYIYMLWCLLQLI